MNAGISLLRGNVGDALLSLAGAIPFAGMAATSAKVTDKIVDAADRAEDALDIVGGAAKRAKDAADEALAAERKRFANVLHQRELGLDQARGGRYLPHEARLGNDLEQRLGRRLRRANKDEAGDWVDGAGRHYDGVGPVQSAHFKFDEFTDQITKHLRKQGLYRIVVDMRGLSPSQLEAVDNFLKSIPAAGMARIIFFR